MAIKVIIKNILLEIPDKSDTITNIDYNNNQSERLSSFLSV